MPFYYGWVVLACLCCAGFARQSPAVATLSIFVAPMTAEFGWSRAALSGAVSLGGLLAGVATPFLGPLLDRHGARAMLCTAVLLTGGAAMLLSLTPSLPIFYLLFCTARMNWAGPFDLGIYGAVNNWFVARRALATSIVTLAQTTGLVALPLIAQAAIVRDGWRSGWLAVGGITLLLGFAPCWFLLVRRPEDMGLEPDRARGSSTGDGILEPAFSRRQAMRTAAFWLLATYTMLLYPVQAGVSLHQASHLIERGLDPGTAATVVSFFSLMSAGASFAVGMLPRRLPIRWVMLATALILGSGVALMPGIGGRPQAFLAAGLFGAGIGSVLTLLPIAWADYFGRRSYGAIRGVALTLQVLSQATGPLLSGLLRDWSGSYAWSLQCFASLAFLAAIVALIARRPPSPA